MRKRIEEIADVWRKEFEMVMRDQGVLIFFLLVPLLYPILYAWIYNNEVVREVPVAVVDDSRSHVSRSFIRQCDATPDVRVVARPSSMAEAQQMMSRGEVRGIYVIPADFSSHLYRGEPATVRVYCDMGVMLYYKAIFQTATNVAMSMGRQVAPPPLIIDEVAMFNPSGGYGNFILPGVLMLILQQTLVLGIGMSAGTSRERNSYGFLVPYSRQGKVGNLMIGKVVCYLMIYMVLGVYLTVLIPRLFHFVQLVSIGTLLLLLLPYILASIFFGLTVSCLVRYRENVMLLVVFFSVPLLFISGVSWPQSNIPAFWQSVAWLFPSTFGIRAFVRANSMGATLSDMTVEYVALWVQVVVYGCLAYGVYRFQSVMAHSYVLERLMAIKRKREVRRRFKARRQRSRSLEYQ